MTGYHSTARFYNAVQDQAPLEHAAYLRELVHTYAPNAQTILELACGTGQIIEQLRDEYEMTGLDVSPEMLAIAHNTLPDVRLIEADMANFDIDETFDVVLAPFSAVNNLPRFDQWRAAFQCAHAHLDDGGVFIFDANTEHGLATARGLLDHRWIGDNFFMVTGRERTDLPGICTVWEIRVFEHDSNGCYQLHAEDIPEVAYPTRDITDALNRIFRTVTLRDRLTFDPTPTSRRIHFVCRR